MTKKTKSSIAIKSAKASIHADRSTVFAVIVDMIGGLVNGIFQNVNSHYRNLARKKLTAIANAMTNKIADNQALITKVMEWKATRSANITNSIFSASGFGSAFRQFQDELKRMEADSNKAINQANEENKKLNSAINDVNTVMGNMDQTIPGLITAVSVNNNDDVNKIVSSNTNNDSASETDNQGSRFTLTNSGSFGK